MSEHEARAALKACLGQGARYDAPNAPADDLLLARRGKAYFARYLNDLTDDELFAPSKRAGLSRAHIVAEVSYAARYQAMALAVLSGLAVPGMDDEYPVFPTIDLAATLPARALRFLFHHAEVHLNVCWRDLANADWDKGVSLPDGTEIAARALPMIHAQKVWYGALELGSGSRLEDFPKPLLAGCSV